MRIVATSDLHGRLPRIPPCDVLIVAGDITPIEYDRDASAVLKWMSRRFMPWLEAADADHIIGIAGNHDFFFEDDPKRALGIPWHYLLDSGITIDHISFWGTPWVPNLRDGAFYGDRNQLECAYYGIPEDANVMISHGPPMGHLDNTQSHFGASQVNDAIKRVKPELFICGHIHEGYGVERGYRNHTDIYNVSHCDYFYDPVNPPVIIDLDV